MGARLPKESRTLVILYPQGNSFPKIFFCNVMGSAAVQKIYATEFESFVKTVSPVRQCITAQQLLPLNIFFGLLFLLPRLYTGLTSGHLVSNIQSTEWCRDRRLTPSFFLRLLSGLDPPSQHKTVGQKGLVNPFFS